DQKPFVGLRFRMITGKIQRSESAGIAAPGHRAKEEQRPHGVPCPRLPDLGAITDPKRPPVFLRPLSPRRCGGAERETESRQGGEGADEHSLRNEAEAQARARVV